MDEAVIKVITSYPDVRLAILFGSAARQQERPESDIDLAVATKNERLTAEKIFGLIKDLARVCSRPVDLIDLNVVSGTILRQVLTGGRVVYCSDRTLYGRLIVRMLAEQADMMPYHNRILRERRDAWIAS
jgi:predicted nucleotidyltransferase